MLSREYKKAVSEVLDILDHTRKKDVDKISPTFMKFLKKNVDRMYKPELDHTKKIKDMNLRKETLSILALINKKFWCAS